MASTPETLRSPAVLVAALLPLLLVLDGNRPRAAASDAGPSASVQRSMPGGGAATVALPDDGLTAVSPLETLVAREDAAPRRVVSLAPVRWLDTEGKWQDVEARFVPSPEGGFETAADRLRARAPARADGSMQLARADEGLALAWSAGSLRLNGSFGGSWILAPGPSPAPARPQPDGSLSYATWPGVSERLSLEPGLVKHDVVLERLPPGGPGDELVLSWHLSLGALDVARGALPSLAGSGPTGVESDGAGGLRVVSASGAALLWLPAPFLAEDLADEDLDAAALPGLPAERDPADADAPAPLELSWRAVDDDTGLRLELALPMAELHARADAFPLVIDPTVVDLSSPEGVLLVFAASRFDLLGERRGLAAGDFNGDGKLDLAVGAHRGDGLGDSKPDAGEVHVLFGPLASGTRDLATDKGEVVVVGADAFDTMGWAVAAGDLNDDGIDDLVLGAPFADGPTGARSGAGEVQVLLGPLPPGGLIDLSFRPGDLVVHGRARSHGVGYSVAVGDVTGDGIGDLVFGAPRSDGPDGLRAGAGAAHVLAGPFARGPARRVVDLATSMSDAVMHGASPGDQVGAAVAAGDLDGDGRADLVVSSLSSNGRDDLRPQSGEIHVLFAPVPDDLVRDLALEPADAVVFGARAGDLLGHDLAIADLSGDGVGDLATGAHLSDGPDGTRDRAGAVAVLFGPFAAGEQRDLAQGAADVLVHGAAVRDLAGWSVAAGDLTGDGRADLLFGAVAADGPGDSRTGCGELHALFGPLSAGTELDLAASGADVEVQGAGSSDQLGHAVLVADLTGDGVGDLVSAAKTARGPGDSRPAGGEAVVVAGQATGCLSDADCDDEVDCTADSCDPASGECTNDDAPCNEPPACDAGGERGGSCRELPLQGVSVEDPDGDALEYRWVSSDPAVVVLPPGGSLPAGEGARVLPASVALLSDDEACGREVLLTLVVSDGRGGEGRCETRLRFEDLAAPMLVGVPADATAGCDAVPAPAPVFASDDCDAEPALSLDEQRLDGDCPSEYRLLRTWTAVDRCGNSASAVQVVEVVDEQAPVVVSSRERVRCLWPPDHRMVHFDRSDFAPEVSDGCGGAVSWRFVDCASNQPADDTGDGETEIDCVVDEDGAGFSVRAERSGTRLTPREYSVSVVAADACGNESGAVVVGTIGVSHDRGLRVGSGDCSGPSSSVRR